VNIHIKNDWEFNAMSTPLDKLKKQIAQQEEEIEVLENQIAEKEKEATQLSEASDQMMTSNGMTTIRPQSK
jgi:predicted  nucleic acid-binding Zn-ribbon protein